jgi:hypothetical protein
MASKSTLAPCIQCRWMDLGLDLMAEGGLGRLGVVFVIRYLFGLICFDLCTLRLEVHVFMISFSLFSLPFFFLFSLCSLSALLNYKDPSVRRIENNESHPTFPHCCVHLSLSLSLSRSFSLSLCHCPLVVVSSLSSICSSARRPCRLSAAVTVVVVLELTEFRRLVFYFIYLHITHHLGAPSHCFTPSLLYTLTPVCVYHHQAASAQRFRNLLHVSTKTISGLEIVIA